MARLHATGVVAALVAAVAMGILTAGRTAGAAMVAAGSAAAATSGEATSFVGPLPESNVSPVVAAAAAAGAPADGALVPAAALDELLGDVSTVAASRVEEDDAALPAIDDQEGKTTLDAADHQWQSRRARRRARQARARRARRRARRARRARARRARRARRRARRNGGGGGGGGGGSGRPATCILAVQDALNVPPRWYLRRNGIRLEQTVVLRTVRTARRRPGGRLGRRASTTTAFVCTKRWFRVPGRGWGGRPHRYRPRTVCERAGGRGQVCRTPWLRRRFPAVCAPQLRRVGSVWPAVNMPTEGGTRCDEDPQPSPEF
ncbi:hypothetical protein I4F81_012788 [Pyropia yezoensis]|uniref:Uncharacterized protein n=1 Tax=Pyropia yezoensis TaxID=2788 RepID=A0ACC3CJZ7_PYRYE|nr:hypothetical protein I4F81_012788 [Neopyropia yezoensis]